MYILILTILFMATKSSCPSQGQKEISAHNSWYEVRVADDVDDPGPGPYALFTYDSHPWGGGKYITSGYSSGGMWCSYITIRDYTAHKEYVLAYTYNDFGFNRMYLVSPTSGWGDHESASTYGFRTGQGTFDGGTGVRETWSIPDPAVTDVVQELKAEDLGDFVSSRIRITAKITNTTGGTREYGIRMLFDINVANNDSAYFWDYTSWRDHETAWDLPIPFIRYAVSKVPDTSSDRYIYGNICDSSYGMEPTPPEHFSYAFWGDWNSPFANGLWASAWEDCAWQNRILGGDDDGAVAYWWGYSTPISLSSGETFVANQYFFARKEPPAGVETPETPVAQWVRIINTTGSKFVLKFNLAKPTNVSLSLYNVAGRLVLNRDINAHKDITSFYVPEFPGGIYFLQVKTDNIRKTFKITKF